MSITTKNVTSRRLCNILVPVYHYNTRYIPSTTLHTMTQCNRTIALLCYNNGAITRSIR